jgi:hypothetical protein
VAGVGPLNPPSIDQSPVAASSTAAPGGNSGAPAPAVTAAAASGGAAQAQNSAAAQWLDQPDIHILDVPAALQILLFEVSDAWGLDLPAVPAQDADQAAGMILDGFLRTVPDADPIDRADPTGLAWARAADQSEAALERGIDRAIGIVGAWRGVTEDVIASIAASRQIIMAALLDEPSPRFLTRPEWLGLAARIERYRRRRRSVRRLQDPDDAAPR